MIALHTLGAVDLRKDGKEISTILAQPKRLALLAYLAAARPRGFHSRETLLALFWPESDGERARNSLRQALHHLRRSLGDAAVPGRGDREVGLDFALLECDAVAFDDAIAAGRWEDAVRLFRGDFLPGLFVQDAPEAERWLDDERARRRRDAVMAAWHLTDDTEHAGDLGAAERWARVAVGLDPLDEAGIRRLLALLDRAGDPAGVLATYEELTRRLRAEYAIEPAAETTRFVEEVRERATRRPASAPKRSASAAQPGLSVTDDTRDRDARQSVGPPPEPSADGPPPRDGSLPPGESAPPAAPARDLVRRRPGGRRLGVAAAVLALVIAAGWAAARGGVIGWLQNTPDAPAPTIAVLPFVNMSADPDNDYLSDGLSEELLNLLAQVPGLQVAARTSSFTFKDRNVPVDSIGRVLRVRHVLEGSVRQAGPRVRITAQLIDAQSGYHLWSGTFDTRVEDVVAVQDSIGRLIVETLRPRLAGPVGAPAQRREPSDPAAHVAVLKGWNAFRLNTREAYEAAALHFQDAIRRDPDYGRAYGGLATVRMWQASFRHVPVDAGYAEADSLARRALALDSSLTDAYAVLGRIAEMRDRDDAAAEALYARAIAMNPNEARAYSRRGAVLVRLGRADEGIALARRAVELDPASPAVYADLANIYTGLDRYAESEAALRSALAIDPGHPILLGNLALVLIYQEKFEQAADAIAEARRKAPGEAHLIGKQAFVQARLGNAATARALLDTAAAAGLSPVELATTHALLGDRDRALELLERAVRERDDQIVSLLDPAVVPELRGDPRMDRVVAAVKRMGQGRE